MPNTRLVSNVADYRGISESLVHNTKPTLTLLQASKLIIEDQKRRAHVFDPALDANPVWEILLALFVGQLENRPLSTTRACRATNVPASTALRQLSRMESEGFITRRPHAHDRRVTLVALTDTCFRNIMSYVKSLAARWNVEIVSLTHQVFVD